MKLLLLTTLAAIPWLIACVVIAAAVGSILWAVIAAEGIVACMAIASRTWDRLAEMREDREIYGPRL